MSFFNKIIGSASGNVAEINSDNSLRVVNMKPSGNHFGVGAKTGTLAAAIAAGGLVFGMRLNPGYSGVAYIDTLKLRFTCVVAYTTPITQTRSLVVTRGAGANPSGGTNIAVSPTKDTAMGLSNFNTALGGDARISTTAALTVTGITWEATNFGEMTLAHAGAAGAYVEHVYEFGQRNHPIALHPGEILGVRVGPSAMDAAGTWSLGVEVAWRESLTED